MTTERFADLPARLAVNVVLLLVMGSVLALSLEPWFQPFVVACVSGFAMLALWECYQLLEATGQTPSGALGLASVFPFYFLLWFAPSFSLLVPWCLLMLLFLTRFRAVMGAANHVGATLFGWTYVILPFAAVLMILYGFPEEDGRLWLVYAVAVTKFGDTAAFFAGKQWGRHKLAPALSPGKTIEGAVAAVLGSSLLSGLFSTWTAMPLTASIILGGVLGALGILGDLAESLLKREAGVKDSNQLQGVGGVLDMLDSLLFTLPLVYFYILGTQF